MKKSEKRQRKWRRWLIRWLLIEVWQYSIVNRNDRLARKIEAIYRQEYGENIT